MAFCKCGDPNCPVSENISKIKEAIQTIGTVYEPLEEMKGTTFMGMIAIKNDTSTFIRFLIRLCNIPENNQDMSPAILESTTNILNAPDLYGNTPMHYFAARGDEHKEKFPLFMGFGACLCIRNNAGESVLDVLHTNTITLIEDGDEMGIMFDTVSAEIFGVARKPKSVYVYKIE